MKPTKDGSYIRELQKLPLFQQGMEQINKNHRPIVKKYDVRNPQAVEQWKYECARQDGFDFLFSLLTGVTHE